MTRSPRTSPARPALPQPSGAPAGRLLAACSSGALDVQRPDGLVLDPAAGRQPSRVAGTPVGRQPPPAGGDRGGTTTAARVLPSDRDVVYRGSITVQVQDVVGGGPRRDLATGWTASFSE
jgi:hypothetical protein